MHKIVMIGVILLGIVSCKPVTIKEPIRMFEISQEYSEAGTEMVDLNIRHKAKVVGEWLGEVEFIPLSDAPNNLRCFSSEDWYKVIVPKLKEGSRQYHDQ